jgi:hypothetical protein
METVSILKPKSVSAGLSVCRVNSGEIVVSAHEGAQRILLEISLDECVDFAGRLTAFCKEQTEVIDSTSFRASSGS